MGDLISALVEAVRTHQEQAVTGLMSIAGTLLGLVGAVAAYWWKNKGQLKFLPVEIWKRGSPNWENASQYVCTVILCVINTLPEDRTLALTSVGYHSVRPRPWRKTKPLHVDPYPTIGHEKASIRDQDIYLPSKSTLRLHIDTATPPPSADSPEVTASFPQIRWLCLEISLFPKHKSKRIWLNMGDALDLEDPKNYERSGMRFSRS